MIDRQKLIDYSDLELVVAVDRLRLRLRREWSRGEPGKLADAFDLALLYLEANIRGLDVPGPTFLHPGQTRLFDADLYGDVA